VEAEAVAALLGLSPSDARAKIAFSAPEVLNDTDWDSARASAEALLGTGLDVTTIDGRELGRIPWSSPVDALRFGDEALVARLDGAAIELPYNTSLFGVYCQPPSTFAIPNRTSIAPGADGPTIAEALQWLPRLDLYFVREGALNRIAIVGGVTDVKGPGVMPGSTEAGTTAAVVAECARRFEGLELDRRLENVRPRHRFKSGEQGFDLDLRKLYSFGTLLLRQTLESISSDLRDVTHYELGSRLAYVLSKHDRG
jgi:hypothetical protein